MGTHLSYLIKNIIIIIIIIIIITIITFFCGYGDGVLDLNLTKR